MISSVVLRAKYCRVLEVFAQFYSTIEEIRAAKNEIGVRLKKYINAGRDGEYFQSRLFETAMLLEDLAQKIISNKDAFEEPLLAVAYDLVQTTADQLYLLAEIVRIAISRG